jgi:hypothetical protein
MRRYLHVLLVIVGKLIQITEFGSSFLVVERLLGQVFDRVGE